ESHAEARWHLAEGAHLSCAPEPTVAYADAAHHARTTVRLEPGASLAWLDTLAAHGAFERVTSSLRVFFGDALAVHDAYDVRPRHLAGAVGTALFLRSGMTPERSARLVAAADAAATLARADPEIAVGVGSPAAGGVFVRATGRHVRAVRSVLATLLVALRRIDVAAESPSG
ncbi:MAG: urease accessory protein UreD, partial [Candidatus Eremiobacteraeota bacterium]|nr:urease accessory protein UreD [Candidatus Eremiobacteraeota bacterium]